MNTLCISERVEELEYSYTDGGNVKQYSYFSKQFIHFLTSNTYWASLIAQLEKNLPAMQETLVNSWSGKSAGEGIVYPLQDSSASLLAQLLKNRPAM